MACDYILKRGFVFSRMTWATIVLVPRSSPEIDRLIAERGYQTYDVVSMYPDHPEKETLRKKFLGDLLSVPANTKHWFDMGPNPAFTATPGSDRPREISKSGKMENSLTDEI